MQPFAAAHVDPEFRRDWREAARKRGDDTLLVMSDKYPSMTITAPND